MKLQGETVSVETLISFVGSLVKFIVYINGGLFWSVQPHQVIIRTFAQLSRSRALISLSGNKVVVDLGNLSFLETDRLDLVFEIIFRLLCFVDLKDF